MGNNVSDADLKIAFANINSGLDDFYEYELAEVLRMYFVKNILDNDKSLIRNDLMDKFYELLESVYDYYKNNKGQCDVTN